VFLRIKNFKGKKGSFFFGKSYQFFFKIVYMYIHNKFQKKNKIVFSKNSSLLPPTCKIGLIFDIIYYILVKNQPRGKLGVKREKICLFLAFFEKN
jgi:hypothetical protein